MMYEPLGKFVKLSQGLAVNKGTAHLFSNTKTDEFIYPLLRIVDFERGSNTDFSKYVTKNIQKTVIITEDTIVFSRVTCQCFRGFSGVVHNNLFVVELTNDLLDKDYLFAVLQSDFVQKQALKLAQSSVVPDLTHDMFKSIVIPVPSKETQQRITALYYTISSKISVNSSICADIENMAKTIFHYWFMQFDFPDANNRPYRASGGAMEWNSKIGRALPKGWDVRYLSEIFETKLGGTPNSKEESFWNGDIPWLSSGEVAQSPILSSEKTITSQGMKCSSTSFAGKGTVLLSITRYIRPAILGIDACFNQSVVAIIPNKKYRTEYLYQVILSQVDRYMTLRRGAQQPHINKEIVDKTLVVCPPGEILQKYYDAVEPLYSMHMNAAKENRELTKLRDWLLPMLMNGQATVE